MTETRSKYNLPNPGSGRVWTPTDAIVDVTGRDFRFADNRGFVRTTEFLPSPDKYYAPRAFSHPTFGTDMAINAAIDTGQDELIYDGESSLWTVSTVVGAAGAFVSSTDQNHTPAGTTSIDFSASVGGDIIQFKASSMMNTAMFSSLIGWLYLTSWEQSNSEILISLYNTVTGTQVGSTGLVSGCIDTTVLNQWQQCVTPINSLVTGSQNFDAIRLTMIGSPGVFVSNGFIDDISLSSTSAGGPYVYEIQYFPGERSVLNGFRIAASADYDGTTGADYSKLLNQSLTSGISYRQLVAGVAVFSFNFKSLFDLISFPGTNISGYGSDGTGTYIYIDIEYDMGEYVDAGRGDAFQVVLSDNLSGFTNLKIFARTSLIIA